jgi:hypothetical protein
MYDDPKEISTDSELAIYKSPTLRQKELLKKRGGGEGEKNGRSIEKRKPETSMRNTIIITTKRITELCKGGSMKIRRRNRRR